MLEYFIISNLGHLEINSELAPEQNNKKLVMMLFFFGLFNFFFFINLLNKLYLGFNKLNSFLTY